MSMDALEMTVKHATNLVVCRPGKSGGVILSTIALVLTGYGLLATGKDTLRFRFTHLPRVDAVTPGEVELKAFMSASVGTLPFSKIKPFSIDPPVGGPNELMSYSHVNIYIYICICVYMHIYDI